MFSMQSVSKNPFIATFQFLFAASLNLGWSQKGVLGNGLKCLANKKNSILIKLEVLQPTRIEIQYNLYSETNQGK